MLKNRFLQKFLVVLGAIMLVFGIFQLRYIIFAPKPIFEFWEKGDRQPDLQIWIDDLTFDINSRNVEYRIDVRLRTSIQEEEGFWLSLSSNFVHERIYLTYYNFGKTFTYQSPPGIITDKSTGISEPYPYDSYKIHCQFSMYSPRRLDFPEGFEPYVLVFMAYPSSLGWQAQGYGTSIIQEERGDGFLIKFDAIVTIGRTPGYSLAVFLPILATTLVLGTSIFLEAKKNEKSLTDRLTLYISLFVFAPVFMYVVGPQVSIRWLMTIPEMLMVAIILNTAVFLSFSIISTYSYNPRKWDGYSVIFSVFSSFFFVIVTSLFYYLYWIRIHPPGYGGVYPSTILSWFLDARIIPWILLLAFSYILPYCKKYRGSKHSVLSIFLLGSFVFMLSSFQIFYDPSTLIVSLFYVGFALLAWKEKILGLIHNLFNILKSLKTNCA